MSNWLARRAPRVAGEKIRRMSPRFGYYLHIVHNHLLSMHLMMCKRCSNFSRQIEFLRRASRKIPEVLEKDRD